MTTESTRHIIYAAEDAGMSEVHEAGKWYFEPVNCMVVIYALTCWLLIEYLAKRWHQRKLWRNVVRRVMEG